jgi:hypothetical protein
VNDFNKENSNPLKKEIKEDYRRWKDLLCLWIHRINTVKMAILSKAIHIFKAIPIKIPRTFIPELERSNLKLIWKHKRLQIAKARLSKKSNAGGFTIPDFKLYYKAIAIKTAWQCHKTAMKTSATGQMTDMNPHNYTHLIFDKGAKNIDGEKTAIQQILL